MSTQQDRESSATDFGELDESVSDNSGYGLLASELPELQRAVGVGAVVSEQQQKQQGWCNGTALDKSLLHGGSIELSRLRFHIYVTLGSEARDVFDGIVLDQLRVAERMQQVQNRTGNEAPRPGATLERAPHGVVLH